ncbi:MAG: T9SS type A sorting domain-containing protein [Saprospiraceae bacterium]|nr:T9SS type A sorting domain-containing protein [Saprospiraceae bacterium]
MNSKLIITLCTLLLSNSAFSQVCGILGGVDVNSFYSANTSSINIRAYWYIVKDGNGNGTNTTQFVNQVIDNVESTFSSVGINLLSTCYQRNLKTLNNDLMYNSVVSTTSTDLCNFTSSCRPDGLNIFILDGEGSGLASVPGNLCFAKISEVNDFQVIVHEIGHCLGLWHTFHGRPYWIPLPGVNNFWECDNQGGVTGTNVNLLSCNGINFTHFVPFEFVNGTNGMTSGDFVQDTPADVDISQNCEGNVYLNCSNNDPDCDALNDDKRKDPHCDKYEPDWNNFMGYRHGCRDHFTEGQTSRMKAIIEQHLGYMIFSGSNAPNVIPNYSNSCSNPIVNLNSLHIGSIPPNATLVWSTDSNPENGISPIINPVVTTSGTYFAYYYYSIDDCYSPASNSTIVNVNNYILDDYILDSNTPNTLLTGQYLFGGNMIIRSGAELHIHLAQIIFSPNKGIIVENGGRLLLQGSTLDACNPTQSWAGIKIQSGGFFDTDDTYLNNVLNGVEAKGSCTLQVFNLNISGKGNTSGTGFEIEDNVNVDFIYELGITQFNTGIYAYNSVKPIELNHGGLSNCTYGIRSISAPLIINDYSIEFTKYGVDLMLSPGSSFFDSDIWVQDHGLSIVLSPNTMVRDNWIFNLDNKNTWAAIGIVLSDNCSIINNPQISSAINAIGSFGSNYLTIQGNAIETQLSNNTQLAGGPVNLGYGNGNRVINNYIDAIHSEFGINTTWNSNTTIEMNNINVEGLGKFFRTTAIKQEGSLGEDVIGNIVQNYGNASGILILNSTGGIYDCNDIKSNNEGMDLYYASDEQWITANTLMADGEDLTIRSAIGEQATRNANNIIVSNNGNKFVGGYVLAEGLDQTQILASQFPLNGDNPYHMPAHPTPSSGWFMPNEVDPFENCNGVIIGPDWLMFNNNPNKICAYWNYLKSIQTSKPELFITKLVHLLKYAKIKSGFTLPNCIKFDPVFQTLCGVTKLVDVSVALAKLSEHNINTYTLTSLQTQYNNETTDAGKAAVRNQLAIEMVTLMPQFTNEALADSVRLDSLKNELNTINCTSIIVNKWKEILKLYVNFIRKGKVEENDKSVLESYSTDCSDLYGEAIHLARAMANTYTSTYYDVHDGCLEESEPRVTSSQKSYALSVSPNPTSDKISFSLPINFEGRAIVYDMNGRLVQAHENLNTSIKTLDLSNENAGMYIVRIVSIDGTSTDHKVILIK